MIYNNKDRALLRFADQKNPQFGFYNHICIIFQLAPFLFYRLVQYKKCNIAVKKLFVIIINVMATFFSLIS